MKQHFRIACVVLLAVAARAAIAVPSATWSLLRVAVFANCLLTTSSALAEHLANGGFRVSVDVGEDGVNAEIVDIRTGRQVSSGPYWYSAVKAGRTSRLKNASVALDVDRLVVRGQLADLEVEHTFSLPADRPIMEERIVLHNKTGQRIALEDLQSGLTLPIANAAGEVLEALQADRLMAVPFLQRADDPPGLRHELSLADLAAYRPGAPLQDEAKKRQESIRSRLDYLNEGWAWVRGTDVLGIFKFCQEHMQFSIVAPQPAADGIRLRFGGAAMAAREPSDLTRIAPGQSVDLGVTRYQSLRGGHREACYAFRAMLDEMGCRFPKTFNPPVHWEQLYDMTGAWTNRPELYTKAALEREAVKARAYSCEALYLDPGWDTDFGTFLWGEQWLGPRKAFIDGMRTNHGLKVSVHCPLAPWMSIGPTKYGKEPWKSWPLEARMEPNASVICLGSQAYLDTAAERLQANCADGVAFLMFDGNQFFPCNNPRHGHPIPYTKEDHIRANLELARRIHAKYPNVLIEMHDMLKAGHTNRPTPIYYKYGLPGSYDETWGFELMWNGLREIYTGHALTLYYANLGCNVPIYLHTTLTNDNEHCLVLWWYASTCRHLGIGGTHRNPKIVQAQQEAMRWYRANDRFFKRGDFYGISEEIHLHVLPAESGAVVNVFNLSDKPKTVSGSIDLREIGLSADATYVAAEGIGTVSGGRLQVEAALPAWGTRVGTIEAQEAAGTEKP